MGGFFGVASKEDCVFDLYFGTDYHSHLGTRRAGMAVHGKRGFNRAIHNIENSPFRTKFESDANEMEGNLGIGCISDFEPQPIVLRSHLGTFALTTVGKINNQAELIEQVFEAGHGQFMEMSGGYINPTELVGALINQKDSIAEGIRFAQACVDGSLSLLLMTDEGIYAARDLMGRTPVVIGKKENAHCVCFESFSFLNMEYIPLMELGPGQIVFITPEEVRTLVEPRKEMRICTFLWVYYGYPSSSYEGISVERMRMQCGAALAKRDMERGRVDADAVTGIPDSGTAHAIGYSNVSGIPFTRPFVKYTPTWPRSFMPTIQSKRDFIARMKLVPIYDLIEGQNMVVIDDSIVRGTQLRDKTKFLEENGAKEMHVRPSCPPILFGCKYLNFSRSTSEMELITRRMIARLEGDGIHLSPEKLALYADPESEEYAAMLEEIRKELNFTTLHYNRLDDTVESVGISPCRLCTYCWSGKE